MFPAFPGNIRRLKGLALEDPSNFQPSQVFFGYNIFSFDPLYGEMIIAVVYIPEYVWQMLL